MANLTEILGTHSIGATRHIMNDNFQLLNDEIKDLTSFLDPLNSQLDIDVVNSSELKLSRSQGGGTQSIAEIDGAKARFSVNLRAKAGIWAEEAIYKSGKKGTTSNPVQSLATEDLKLSTIMADKNLDLPVGAGEGHEVTFISLEDTGIMIQPGNGKIAVRGGSEIALHTKYSTVTLRWLSDGSQLWWFIIGGHDYSIN
jgi:hypothetical protein